MLNSNTKGGTAWKEEWFGLYLAVLSKADSSAFNVVLLSSN